MRRTVQTFVLFLFACSPGMVLAKPGAPRPTAPGLSIPQSQLHPAKPPVAPELPIPATRLLLEFYEIPIDYSQDVKTKLAPALVKKNKFDQIEGLRNEKDVIFGPRLYTSLQILRLYLLQFDGKDLGGEITAANARRYITAFGDQPGRPEQLLALAAENPNRQRTDCIVAVGTSTSATFFLAIDGDAKERRLYGISMTTEEGPAEIDTRCLFLAVRPVVKMPPELDPIPVPKK